MPEIRAAHYAETIKKLKADPIIQEMAASIPADFDLTSWNFMTRSLDVYKERGGVVETHIGGPAEAIAELVAEVRQRRLDESSR